MTTDHDRAEAIVNAAMKRRPPAREYSFPDEFTGPFYEALRIADNETILRLRRERKSRT